MPLAEREFRPELVKAELEDGIRKARGGVLELVLRDTHTCQSDPLRFGQWVEIARRAIEEQWA